jgi:hypothetical protein
LRPYYIGFLLCFFVVARIHVSVWSPIAAFCHIFLLRFLHSHASSSIDAQVTAAIKAGDKQLAAYLKSTFSLSNGDKPHALKF